MQRQLPLKSGHQNRRAHPDTTAPRLNPRRGAAVCGTVSPKRCHSRRLARLGVQWTVPGLLKLML